MNAEYRCDGIWYVMDLPPKTLFPYQKDWHYSNEFLMGDGFVTPDEIVFSGRRFYSDTDDLFEYRDEMMLRLETCDRIRYGNFVADVLQAQFSFTFGASMNHVNLEVRFTTTDTRGLLQ